MHFASPRKWLAITAKSFMDYTYHQNQLSSPILQQLCERKKKTCLDPEYIDTFNIYPQKQVDCVVDNVQDPSVDPYKKPALISVDPYLVDPLISVASFKIDPLIEPEKGESPNEKNSFLPINSDAPKVQSVKCTVEVHCGDLYTPDPLLESSFVSDQGEGYEPTSTALHQPSISLTTIPAVIPQDATIVASIPRERKIQAKMSPWTSSHIS
jgi:hypothetical protein